VRSIARGHPAQCCAGAAGPRGRGTDHKFRSSHPHDAAGVPSASRPKRNRSREPFCSRRSPNMPAAGSRAASAAACWCARVPQAFQQVSHAVRWCLVTDRDSSASRRHAISALPASNCYAWLWAPDSASFRARRSGRSGRRPASFALRGDGRFRMRTCLPKRAMQNAQSLGDIAVEVAKEPVYLPDFSPSAGRALYGIVRSHLIRRLARHAHRWT
jgi:hypothetical protein